MPTLSRERAAELMQRWEHAVAQAHAVALRASC